jgi:Tfp pilus assembly protein PilE
MREIPGTDGPNRFSTPPPPNTTGAVVLALIIPLIFILGIVAAIALPAYQQYVNRAHATQQ